MTRLADTAQAIVDELQKHISTEEQALAKSLETVLASLRSCLMRKEREDNALLTDLHAIDDAIEGIVSELKASNVP